VEVQSQEILDASLLSMYESMESCFNEPIQIDESSFRGRRVSIIKVNRARGIRNILTRKKSELTKTTGQLPNWPSDGPLHAYKRSSSARIVAIISILSTTNLFFLSALFPFPPAACYFLPVPPTSSSYQQQQDHTTPPHFFRLAAAT